VSALTTADGRRLTYRELGDGPPLVCHPGGPGIPALIFDDLAGLLPLLFARYGENEQAYMERAAASGVGYSVRSLQYFNEQVAPTMDLRPLLPEIGAQTLVITGELDAWGAWAVPELESGIRGTQVVVMPGVGHMPWVEEREGFRRALLQFLG
jgi:pimeloyl-ACP methyl ester carboxylesterase